MVAEPVEEDGEEDDQHQRDEDGEGLGRVDPGRRRFGHDEGWDLIVQLRWLRLGERVPEVDEHIGDVLAGLLVEAVVADDDLQAVLSRQVLDLFLNRARRTGSPRSSTASNDSESLFHWASTGSDTLSKA